MRPNALLWYLLLPLVLAQSNNDTILLEDEAILLDNNTLILNNGTMLQLEDVGNDTLVELDGDHEPIVRKKRTFGDIVFRGLADVLGYRVQRKPPQVQFPPPLPPVPGIDAPLQVSLTASAFQPALATAIQAAPAVLAVPAAPAVPPAAVVQPCGTPRAAGPPPCRAQLPPPPKAVAQPCASPRAAQPPPCGTPRANPPAQAPCAPAPPPAKADNLDRVQSNLQFSFNFNRNAATPAPIVAGADATVANVDEQAQPQPQPQAAIPIQPRAAKLPPPQPIRKPRIYVDAFVVRNGVTQRVDTVDAEQFSARRSAAEDDYLAYDDEEEAAPPQQQPAYDDYEDAQESRDRAKAVREFGTAVGRFWEEKKRQPQPKKNAVARKEKRLPPNHYRNVHFGDRELANQIQRRSDSHESLQRDGARPNRIPRPQLEEPEDEYEGTTSTEDPRRPLRPRVLPPTEQNPGQIDTVTVRVPPIYKEKRPKKLHRGKPNPPDRDEENVSEEVGNSGERDFEDSDGENSAVTSNTERPLRRRRRRKQRRKARDVDQTKNRNVEESKEDSVEKSKPNADEGSEGYTSGESEGYTSGESEAFTALDYDYYGNKLPISEEEKSYRQLTVPPPTMDADIARHEKSAEGNGHFLNDHERLKEDPERIKEDYRSRDDSDEDKADESERADERERSVVDAERTGDKGRADSKERTDELSPNARIQETGYKNNFVHATNVVVDNPEPAVATVKRKTVKIGTA